LKKRVGRPCSMIRLFVIAITAISGSWNGQLNGQTDTPDKFETVRTHIQAWLGDVSTEGMQLSASRLKETIVDDWSRRKDAYQIVSVRKPEDYGKAGHIPNAKNTYWINIIDDESLAGFDSKKTIVLYCYYGHASMISYTLLELLGYTCRSLNFGMMGWNLDALVKGPWDRKADYEVELTVNESKESYPPPVLSSGQPDTVGIIREAGRNYVSGEGSPVISSSDVKEILDDWDSKKAEYQIVDVRSGSDYEAGHVPHAVNIPWRNIADAENVKKLDPARTVIVYSENGQTGQLAATVLCLLGYHAVDIIFGMMDWNVRFVDSDELWTGAAGYPIELSP